MRTPVPGADPDVDEELEAALLSYKQRRAARWGAERFAEELRRRDEAEEHRQVWTSEALAPPVEASVEAQVVDGEPTTFRPEPPRIGFDASFLVTTEHPSTPEFVEEREVVEETVAEERMPATTVEAVRADETAALDEPAAVTDFPEEIEPADEQPDEVAPIEVALPEVPPREIVPEPVAAAVPVAQPRFVPDQAWSAGAAASKRLPAALRHPHVPRPPKPEPVAQTEPKRRWRGKRGHSEPGQASVISAPEWARMSPGARRLYGSDGSDEELRAG